MSYPILQPQQRALFTRLSDNRSKYLWDEMTVGTMFFVPKTDFTESQLKHGFTLTAPDRLTRKGFKISINKCQNESGIDGVLVTRIE